MQSNFYNIFLGVIINILLQKKTSKGFSSEGISCAKLNYMYLKPRTLGLYRRPYQRCQYVDFSWDRSSPSARRSCQTLPRQPVSGAGSGLQSPAGRTWPELQWWSTNRKSAVGEWRRLWPENTKYFIEILSSNKL